MTSPREIGNLGILGSGCKDATNTGKSVNRDNKLIYRPVLYEKHYEDVYSLVEVS